jgi:tetratricopeptide (TPR) repeat protein
MDLRRLLPIIVTWLAVAVATGLVACRDPEVRLAEHEKRGESYLEEGKYREAILEFRNMLQLEPNHAGAHYGLARALIGTQDLRRAYWELQETVRLDPSNLDAKLEYGQFLLFGKEEELALAVELAEAVLAEQPERAAAHVLKARALEAQGQHEEAGEAYARAVEVATDEAGPRLLLANYHRQQGRLAEAEAGFRKLVELEASFAAHAALAGFLASVPDREDEAEATYRAAQELAAPEQLSRATLLLANFFFSRQRFEEAERVLREGIERVEEGLDLIYALARFYHARGDTDRAEAMIQEATRTRPEDPEPLLLLSAYRGRSGDLEGALAAADEALEVAPQHTPARLRRAEVLVDLGHRTQDAVRLAEGRAVVDAVLGREQGHPEALFVKAKIDLAEQKPADAVAALRRALDQRPDWAQAHFLLASALFAQGDRLGARGAAARALDYDAELLPAIRLLAQIHAAQGDHELAVETGQRALARDPNDATMRVLVAQSLVRQRRIDAALAELEKIPEAARRAEEHYALGRVQMLRGDHEAARQYLLAATELEPNRAEILRSLVDLELRGGDLADTAERVAQALAANPEDAQLHQLHGELALFAGRSADAEASFRRGIDLSPNDLRGYQSLARYLALTGRSDEVLETYERALENNPQSGTLHLVVGSLHELQGRKDEAIARYEDAIRLDPSLGIAKNNLAYLLAERGGNLDRALDLAQEAKALLPDNPNAADTLGWVLYKKNVPSAAIGYLREAEGGMSPDDPQLGLVRHHLALAYEANGEPERAREVLERAIRDLDALRAARGMSEPPWMDDLRSMLARLAP